MTTLVHEIGNRLASSAALTTPPGAGLGFQILERWPSPEGPGATPDAFDATRANRLKRVAVVMDGGEVANPARQAFDRRRWDSFPLIYLFGEAHTNGKDAVQSAYLLIEQLLVGWEAIVAGQHIGFLPDSRVALDDSDVFPGNVVSICRFRATSTRKLVAIA